MQPKSVYHTVSTKVIFANKEHESMNYRYAKDWAPLSLSQEIIGHFSDWPKS